MLSIASRWIGCMREVALTSFFRTLLATVIAAFLWPGLFIATVIIFPDAIDPLLGGAQYFLYLANFVWLILVFMSIVVLAKIFSWKRSRSLFVVTSTISTIFIWIGLGIFDLFERYQSIGRPGVVYPDGIDDVLNWEAFRSLIESSAWIGAICLATAILFVFLGGLKGWVMPNSQDGER